MKSFIIAATAVTLTTGALLSTAAEANPYQRHYGQNLTHSERAALSHSRAHLKAIQRRAYFDGRLSPWERMRLNAAQARHKALAYRLRHN